MKVLKNLRTHTNWIILTLLVSIASLIKFIVINRYILPPGMDPGSWLTLAHGYFGGQWCGTHFRHPPLFFVVLGFFGTFFDELIVNKIMGALSFSLIAVPTFFIVKHITGNSRWFAFLASILTLFVDAYMEMLGWGAYPNGLAIVFMFSTFYFVLRYAEKDAKRNLIFVGLFSTLTALTHHLSTLVLISTGLVYVVIASIFGERKRNLLVCLFTTIPCLLILLLIGVLANQTQSITYVNEASFYLRRLSWGKLMYVYGCPFSQVMLVLGSLGVVATWKRGELFPLLLGWFLTPFLLTQLYLVKFPTDYVRFIFYSVQPIIIATAYLFFLIMKRVEKMKFKLRPSKYVALLCIITFGVAEVVAGITQLYFVADYYQRDRKDDYYAVLTWIKENTPKDAVVVATDYYDYWIRGFSQRRVLSAHKSVWLFSPEEVEMAKAAYLLLFGTYEINNGYVRARGMEPIEGTCTPLIGVRWEGKYQDILFLQDRFSKVILDDDSICLYIPWLEWNRTSNWVERSDVGATYQTLYDLEGINITKSVSIKYGLPEAEVTYKAESPKVEAINVTAYIWYSFKIQNVSVSSGELTMTNGKTVVNITCPNANITLNLPYLHIISNSRTLKISLKAKPKTISTPRIETFDYREILKKYNVTYILCEGRLDAGYIPRFKAEDERFQMVFRNPSGTIFKVIATNGEQS